MRALLHLEYLTKQAFLNPVQVKVFQILLNLYYGHFAKSTEPVEPRDQKARFQWSQDTWIINCIKAVYELSNEPQDFPNDCWFHSGRPIRAQPLIRLNRSNQGIRYYRLKDTDPRNQGLELHLLGAALMYPCLCTQSSIEKLKCGIDVFSTPGSSVGTLGT